MMISRISKGRTDRVAASTSDEIVSFPSPDDEAEEEDEEEASSEAVPESQ